MNDKIEYVTIDFETANANMDSACSVGICGAYQGKLVFEKYYLINPFEPFAFQNIAIHGITPKMVEDAPSFKEIWNEIYELINGRIIFAHASTFDMHVLKSLLEKYNLKYPDLKIGCTLKLSKLCFKDILPNCRLGTISEYLEVEHDHHNAISDAKICYYLIERVKRMYQVYDVVDLFEMLNLGFGVLKPEFYRDCYKKNMKVNTKKVISKRFEGKIVAFTGKPKSMTKTEFKNYVINNGGMISRNIDLAVNTFIVFTNPSVAHLNALESVMMKKDILVLDEEGFLKILYDK